MSKFTGRKRKLNYKPILYVAAIALPVIVVVVILAWPKPRTEIVFEQEPSATGVLNEFGTFHLSWQTDVETQGTVYYRYGPDQLYHHAGYTLSRRHVVSIPAKPGDKVEVYVEASGRGVNPAKSPVITIAAETPTTAPAESNKP